MPISDAARPLAGLRVAVTRDVAHADDLAAPLATLGAEVVVVPLVRVEPEAAAALAEALAALPQVDWLVFTSRHGVRRALEAVGGDGARLRGPRVAAVGAATAGALRAAGVVVDVVPARHDAEGLLEALAARPLAGARVLYVAAATAREVLLAGLQRRGAVVTVIRAYRTVPDAEGAAQLRALLPGGIDLVTLAAPSAVRAYSAAAGAHAGALPVATIGPVTTSAAHAAGLTVVAEARDAAARGLAEAVAAWARCR